MLPQILHATTNIACYHKYCMLPQILHVTTKEVTCEQSGLHLLEMRWKEGGGRGCQNTRTCWDTVREDVSVKGPRAGEGSCRHMAHQVVAVTAE